MIFARKVWKLLVAIKDGLALIFLLLFFALLYAVLTVRPSIGEVHKGALLLDLDGSIVEEPKVPNPLQILLASKAPVREFSARKIIRALHTAAHDKRIKAVVLDLSRFTGGGFVNLHDIGKALDEVRAAHKPVLTYATLYSDDSLLLAAHASEVWVHPMGGAFIAGAGGDHLYYGRLLDKLKITAHVFRVGKYKSAVEPYIRNDQSPAARRSNEALYGALWSDWKADVSKARPKANIALVSSDPVAWMKASGGDAAKAAKAAGLVDRIGDEVAFGKRVAQLVGKDPADPVPGSFAHTTLATWLAANKPKAPGKAIGVITIAGEIVDGDAGPGLAGGDRIARLLDESLDKHYAALVVRIDSPGGSMMASEEIREAIERYRKKHIPVIVSMANLAASGGYWVTTPANRIFAESGTITGSIGVFAILPTFERALSSIGVTTDGVKTTPLTGQPNLLGGLSPAVSQIIQLSVENDYGRFLKLVAQARGKTPQQVDKVAQGRPWDGRAALKLGLVDQLGGFHDALAYAAKVAKLGPGQWHPVYLGEGTSPLTSLLERLRRRQGGEPFARSVDWAAMAAEHQQAMFGRALADVERIAGTRGVQAYCLECPAEPQAPPPPGVKPAWLALIARAAGFTGFRP